MNETTFDAVTWLIMAAVVVVPILCIVMYVRENREKKDQRRRDWEASRIKPAKRRD